MNFRTLLLLAIMGIIVFTTVTSLLIAQRQNGQAYRTLGDELLRHQADAFERLQRSLGEQASQSTAALAGSVRLFAALEAQDPGVYQIATDELRLGQFSFFRLLDAGGALIEPPPGEGGLSQARFADWLLPRAAAAAARGDQVQIGFVTARVDNGSTPRLYRVLAAPIASFGQRVGTLVLGQRIAGLGSAGDAGDDTAAIPMTHSALWLDGQIAGSRLPAAVREPLRAALETAGSADQGQFQAGASRYRFRLTPLNAGSTFPPASLVALFSMDGFFADQRDLRERIVLAGVAAALLAGLIALALSRQLANPIRHLVAATERIRAGDFDTRLNTSATREFDTLARSFNAMAEDLALKERYHSVLEQVADPQVAEALVAGRVELGGELRDVTVMFCDIRGYTALIVGRPPEAVIELLNHHYGGMASVVRDHRGVINQFAGDAIMALFGAPKRYGDDVLRAVRCALAMLDVRERLNREAHIPVQVGIGIASGPMVAGCIGDARRSDYTVVGEHVNLAARLSSSAAAGEILVDEETHRRLAGALRTEPTAPLSLKGFAPGLRAYRVLGSQPP